MQYLTKSFHSKFMLDLGVNQTNNGFNDCIEKLNKWLAKSKQQDVKVDDFNFTTESNNDDNMIKYNNDIDYQYSKKIRTKLVIIYHHE